MARKLGDGESGRISTAQVARRPPEVFVRPLLHDEAVRLKRRAKRAEHEPSRQRAAILLASNVSMSAPQIAEMWRTDPSWVVIHEFNERGMDSLRPRLGFSALDVECDALADIRGAPQFDVPVPAAGGPTSRSNSGVTTQAGWTL